MQPLAPFDGLAMIAALDAKRIKEGLDWNGLAVALHQQSAGLNAKLGGFDMCSGALVRTAKRGTMSCQYALILLRWIGRPPEDFLAGPVDIVKKVARKALPQAGSDRRLRFDLPSLHAAVNTRRQELGLTWAQLAEEVGCTPARLTNLKTARLADMDLTMRVTQWLRQPAATFITPTEW